ncbi:NADH dehydrogenase subunit 4 (mitochondrion) [Ciona intestinalis B CG-2006]|uniref:NADH-ubiquinone oxidoreductase chain 4 n=3 Tax=Ciona intestinalis TaxID=7719 RepID=A7M804_CIOIN|nr:NADH dehydrogenase subunit 4 [Ciona intestinalis B CG-2006]CAL23357.2 NADH dehydrogenase subunit 4 [Ciona intestinalis]|eukprot:YP_006341034.1 NADH dehydrogenase subunit 4 (mitochondrion) [Ciona intestinalis B CG-2006]
MYLMLVPMVFLFYHKKFMMWFLFYGFFLLFSILPMILKTGEIVFSNHFSSWSGDSISTMLIVLSILVILLSGIIMMEGNRNNYMMMSFFFSMLFLILFFGSDDLLNFLVFFELSMLPIFLLIGWWGKGKERMFSNYYFFLYTLVTSLPMFMLILKTLTLGMESMTMYNFYAMQISWFMFMLLVLGFLTKLPIYGLHIWLPKAHVDAPVGGSMVLAGILLKIGGFGMMRCFMLLGEEVKLTYSVFFIMFLGVWGLLFSGIICLRLTDFKVIVAFSSVSHMSLSVSGLMSYYYWGFKGSYLMFLGHGILSPVLFLFGDLLYKRFHSRHINSLKGLISSSSFMFYLISLFFFAMNFGFPPFVNFFGEIGLFMSLLSFNILQVFFLMGGFLMAGIFMMNMFVMIGQSKKLLFQKMILLNYEKTTIFLFFISYVSMSFLFSSII